MMPAKEERLVLLHNPRCSKSRAAKALLLQRGLDHEERLYLEQPLGLEELRALGRRLGRPPAEWVRAGESAYAEAGLGPGSSAGDLLAAIAAHPILMERPILVRGERACIGRPPEAILALF